MIDLSFGYDEGGTTPAAETDSIWGTLARAGIGFVDSYYKQRELAALEKLRERVAPESYTPPGPGILGGGSLTTFILLAAAVLVLILLLK